MLLEILFIIVMAGAIALVIEDLNILSARKKEKYEDLYREVRNHKE